MFEVGQERERGSEGETEAEKEVEVAGAHRGRQVACPLTGNSCFWTFEIEIQPKSNAAGNGRWQRERRERRKTLLAKWRPELIGEQQQLTGD